MTFRKWIGFPPREPPLVRILGLGAAALCAAAVASGCGREEADDVVNGKTLFVQKCGSCHILDPCEHHRRPGAEPRRGIRPGPRRRPRGGDGRGRGAAADRERAPQQHHAREPGDRRRTPRTWRPTWRWSPASPARTPASWPRRARPRCRRSRSWRRTACSRSTPTRAAPSRSRRSTPRPRRASIEFVMENPSPIEHNIAVKNGTTQEGPVVGTGGTSRFSRQPQARQVRLLLLRAGPRGRRHEGQPDGRVAARRRAPAARPAAPASPAATSAGGSPARSLHRGARLARLSVGRRPSPRA